MTTLAPPLKASTADHALSAVLGDVQASHARVVYPEPLEATAQVLVEALARAGIEARLEPIPLVHHFLHLTPPEFRSISSAYANMSCEHLS